MTAPDPYLLFPGTCREALTGYQRVFGGELTFHTYAEFGRDDGPEDAIAHAMLRGPVTLYGADAAPGEPAVRIEGAFLALLGRADPDTLHGWFRDLATGGEVIDPMRPRAWNATDGQVDDANGVRWLIGYEHDPSS